MAIKLYFDSTPQTTISEAINSGWTGSHASFDRYWLETTAASSFVTLTNTKSMASGESYCFGQWWSHPINNAGSFSSTDWDGSLWTTLIRFSESAAAANRRYKFQMRIYDGGVFTWNSYFTGGTEFDVGNGSTTNSLMEARRCNNCDYWGAITASNGARIVMEVGDYKSAGSSASHTSYAEIGGDSGTDLTNGQTDIDQDNPWFKSSLDLTFDAEGGSSTNTNQLTMMGCGT